MAGGPVRVEAMPLGAEREVAELFFTAFPRKLGVALGRRRGIPLLETHVVPGQVVVAFHDDELVGMAGLTYGSRRFVDPPGDAFVSGYGPVIGRVRARLWRTIQTWPRQHQILLEALAVRGEHRGRGIGTALLRAVDDRARALSKNAVILEVVDTNPRAKALYLRCGYRSVHTTRRVLFRLAGFTSADLMVHKVEPALE